MTSWDRGHCWFHSHSLGLDAVDHPIVLALHQAGFHHLFQGTEGGDGGIHCAVTHLINQRLQRKPQKTHLTEKTLGGKATLIQQATVA